MSSVSTNILLGIALGLSLNACDEEQNKTGNKNNVVAESDCSPSNLSGYCEYVLSSNEQVYGLLIADLNGDKIQDIFPHGHDKEDETIFMPSLARSNGLRTPMDRHGCTANDIDLDKDIDIFCAYGARKGEGGIGNKIRINNGDGTFSEAAPTGAKDESGRGRQAEFLNLNGDAFPDLVVTNYADTNKLDSPPSKAFIGAKNYSFEQDTTVDLANSGEACLEIADWNNDGFDGFILCDQQGDSRLFVNKNGRLIDKTNLLNLPDKPSRTWTDAKVVDINNDGLLDFLTVDKFKKLNIYENTGSIIDPFVTPSQTIPLNSLLQLKTETLKPPPSRGVIKLDVFDVNADQILDLYIGTDLARDDGEGKYLGDFVIFGPNYTEFQSLGVALSGTGHVESYDNQSIVVARGGRNWTGEVILLTPKPE